MKRLLIGSLALALVGLTGTTTTGCSKDSDEFVTAGGGGGNTAGGGGAGSGAGAAAQTRSPIVGQLTGDDDSEVSDALTLLVDEALKLGPNDEPLTGF